MRLDGYNPFNTLPNRGIRPVSPAPGNEVVRVDQSASSARIDLTRTTDARHVSASTAVAEYIPARRDNAEPVHGRAGQALASYSAMANMPVHDEVEGVFGIDLYA
ncbi:hypothetical protein HG264_17630 [Pseudomonas sp. gcc21]|uniref:hypothetical protein n=1 Tax=Pseudomonas sp. gcc21 TaxID=2726989 RepID=UPI0014512022|nr:hypothetical protein [Pseudomonas sp. gcc21]QJD60567.1 hypothetical protein HG264_17630 [Pseudomonas sp. gcc21]